MINILTPKITVFCTQCRHSSSDLAETYSEIFYFFWWQVDLKFLLHKLKQLTTNSCISPFPMFTYNIVRLICTLSMFFSENQGKIFFCLLTSASFKLQTCKIMLTCNVSHANSAVLLRCRLYWGGQLAETAIDDVRCQSRFGTIKTHSCSKSISAKHDPNCCSPLP